MKGRKPTPTALLENRDSWHAKTPGRDNTPSPKVERLKCPDWLEGTARKMWVTMSERLFALGVLTLCDENALARYCTLWMRWRECEKFIAENGESFEALNRDGECIAFRRYPESTVAQSLASELRQLEAEFGLTPSSRSRINLDKTGGHIESDEKAEYFEQRS